ncbi:MAG: branched-chain amino acid ABC transporter permease [Geminicoccaceae bacterium]
MTASDYVLSDLVTPFLIMSLAALGLNVLTGYCGQLSLGTGAFMAAGGFMTYKLVTGLPAPEFLTAFSIFGIAPLDIYFPVMLVFSGIITAGVGLLFGLPSLKIKGLYLAITTLAAQFFWSGCSSRCHGSPTPRPPVSRRAAANPLRHRGDGGRGSRHQRYLFVLAITVLAALMVKNVTRCRHGRSWMAIRDMDIAAEIIGISPTFAKLSAFAFSSFLIGIAERSGPSSRSTRCRPMPTRSS